MLRREGWSDYSIVRKPAQPQLHVLDGLLVACASHMESYEPTNNHMHAEEAKVEARAGGKDW